MDRPVIKLRPHHLLCILTYAGRGYTPEFTQNFDRIAESLSKGSKVKIVHGPDDVCAPLGPCVPDYHCRDGEVSLRDTFATQDLELFLGRPLRKNMTIEVDQDLIHRLREGFMNGEIRRACKKCPWDEVCSQIAQDGFQADNLRLYPQIPIAVA